MAFAPSIGDVLSAIQLVNNVYQKCKDAPAEIDAAVKDLKGMKAELESMRDKVGDEKSFVIKNGGAMLATITDTFDPLKEDLHNMRRLIREYIQIPPYSGQKIIFAYFKISDVKKIQESFNNYRAVYSRAFEHSGAVANAQNASQLKDINAKLEAKNKQISIEFAQLKKQQQEAAKIQKDNNAKVDQVLKLLEKMAVSPKTSEKKTSKVEWENELVASGVKRDEVKKIMGPLIWTSLEGKHEPPPIEVTESGPKKVPGDKKDQLQRNKSQSSLKVPEASQPVGKALARARSVSSTRNNSNEKSPIAVKKEAVQKTPIKVKDDFKSPTSISSGTGQRSPSPKKFITKDNGHVWILCVDRNNGYHSILAQTYLELLRLWTANTTPLSSPCHWLFSRVSSAGLTIRNSVKPNNSPSATPPAPSPAINALCSPPDYFISNDYPFEKRTIVKRMNGHKSKVISPADLLTYHYILCFDPAVSAELHKMKSSLESPVQGQTKLDVPSPSPISSSPGAAASSTPKPKPKPKFASKILNLEGCDWFNPDKHTHELEIQELISNMRKAIKNFASRELGWTRPPRGIEQGTFRTLQIVLPRKYRDALVKGMSMGPALVAQGKGETEQCVVRVDWLSWGSGAQLVSVTGPKERLKGAEAWIRGLC